MTCTFKIFYRPVPHTFDAIDDTLCHRHIAAVYGDFGIDNGKSMDQLTEQGRARVFDFTLHIGDIAYNLWDRGDAFMNAISGWARHSPYMVAVGNHEHKDNFTQYVRRFAAHNYTSRRSLSTNPSFYSWNAGLIHYIAINTESYKFPDETANSPFPFTHEEQLEWLEADLREAQANREKQPWIVMYGHKGWYMNVWDKNEKHITTNFTGFDALADQYGVDLYLTGHVHLYQRFLPLRGSADIRRFAPPSHVDRDCASRDKHVYYNPKHMTTIVAGSPGDKELSFVGECAAMGLLNDVAFKSSQVECRDSYGFGLLQAHNSTHLSWIWEETARPSLPPVTMLVDDGSQGHQEEKVGAASVGNSKYKDHLWLVKDRP